MSEAAMARIDQVPETCEKRQIRVLDEIMQASLRSVSAVSEKMESALKAVNGLPNSGRLTESHMEQPKSVRQAVIVNFVNTLGQILNGLSDDQERDGLLDWIEVNIINETSLHRLHSQHYASPGNRHFKWPQNVTQPEHKEANRYLSIDLLPGPYRAVIVACLEADILLNKVTQGPLGEKGANGIEVDLLFLQALKEDGLNPDDWEAKPAYRTVLTVDKNGATHMMLQNNSGILKENKAGIEKALKDFVEEYKKDHPLDPQTAASILLILSPLIRDGKLEWGRLNWPNAIRIEESGSKVTLSRPVQLALEELRTQAGELRLEANQSGFVERVQSILRAGGVIEASSIPEANAALKIAQEEARAQVTEAKVKAEAAISESSEGVTAASLKATQAEAKVRQAEADKAKAEAELTRARGEIASANERLAGRESELSTAKESEAALQARMRKIADAQATLEKELEAASGFLGGSARTAAHQKFAQTVKGITG